MKTLKVFVYLLIFVFVVVAPAFAQISDWPEANPFTAFNAGNDKRIWDKPGNLVFKAKSWLITRFTLTVYEGARGGVDGGFLTLTHREPESNQQITFYYNIRLDSEAMTQVRDAVLSFDLRMWEDGFSNITPATPIRDGDESAKFLKELPTEARLLWVLPPIEGHLTQKEGKYFLSLIAGGPRLNGLITLPLLNVQKFTDIQNERRVKITAAQVGLPTIKWSGGESGYYEFKPGLKEPIYKPTGGVEVSI